MRFLFDTQLIHDPDPSFSYETLRTTGYAAYGGADLGEVISTVQGITPGDWESWYRGWTSLADRVTRIAEACAERGHPISAGAAYLRASNYHRTAEFFLRDDPIGDPRVAVTSEAAIETFQRAHDVRTHWQRVRIPYEGTLLSGYYLDVSGDVPGPTLIAHGGFDSTVEEMYFVVGEAARRYGWNCLIFEGPGQGAALRVDGLPFRHDWEAVVSPVIDFLVELPGVDPDRIALLGMSMGGYLAPRAAAFEPRIAARIAYDGVFDVAAALPGSEGRTRGTVSAERIAALDGLLVSRAELPSALRWMLSNALWVFGVRTAEELLTEIDRYHLADVVERISCPTLVCDAEDEHFFVGQPAQLYAALRCPKTFLEFTAAEGAGEHCHEGALTLFHQRMFDWLDETLRA